VLHVAAALLLALGTAGGAAAGASKGVDCLSCHADQSLTDQAGHSVYVDQAKHKASVHGSLSCTDCHSDISDYPHPEKLSQVACETCHSSEAGDVDASMHKKAASPSCLACHNSPHEIVPVSDPRSPVYQLNVPRTCGTCHGNQDFAKQHGLANVYQGYMDSIHGFALNKSGLLVAASCVSCHGSHKILSHKDPQSRTYRTNIPNTCGSCHAGTKAEYFAGIHGRKLNAGDTKAPVCIDCHTAHQISRAENVAWQAKTPATCGSCHKKQLSTYSDSFHAQVSALGYVEVARCGNCHRNHEILPASDPKSSVAPANLVATCSRCHAGANASFVSYRPHADTRDMKSFPALYFSARFMNLLLGGVLSFFGLHTILWFIRSVVHQAGNHASVDTNA